VFKAFQLLDPQKRKIHNRRYLFREYVLKKLTRCYNFPDYDAIVNQYQDFLNLEKLPLNIEEYKTTNPSSRYHIESFWIDMYKIEEEEEKNPFRLLASSLSISCQYLNQIVLLKGNSVRSV